MTFLDKINLGISTTFIGMGIVFLVLIVLCLVIVIESKLVKLFSSKYKKKVIPEQPYKPAVKTIVDQKGVTSGEMAVSGVEDDETLAIIMTVVSDYADVQLNSLIFKSIKAM